MLDHQGITLLVALGTFLLTGYLYATIPKGFFPIQDTGVIQGVTQSSEDVSFERMATRQQAIAKVILADPDVASLSSFIGVDGTNVTLNSGRLLINLKPEGQRKATVSQIIRRLQRGDRRRRRHLALHAAGAGPDHRHRRQRDPVSVHAREPGPRRCCRQWTPKVLQRLARIPSIVDVASDLQPNGRSVFVDLDRANAARFGITPAIVDNALYDAYGQRIISTIFTQTQPVPGHSRHRPEDAALAQFARTTSTCRRPPRPRARRR